MRDLAPHLRRRALVVGKSTVPVGTAERLTQLLQDRAPAGPDVELAWNPEFLREGFAVEDTLRPDRLVFGVASAWAQAQLARRVRPAARRGHPGGATDLATAELVKVAANSFLATKISYINAMAEVCEATGADVQLLAKALAYDDRIGGRFLKPGLGFGGGCLPKDIRAFMHRAEELGVGQAVAFLREVDAINRRRRERTVDLVREQAGGDLAGVRVCALGAAFKPNSDDIRDAPALDVGRMLQEEGADVRVYDPEAMDNARRAYPDLHYADGVMEAADGRRRRGAAHRVGPVPRDRPRPARPVVAGRVIVDGRHALDADAWRAAGWDYRALGRGELGAAGHLEGQPGGAQPQCRPEAVTGDDDDAVVTGDGDRADAATPLAVAVPGGDRQPGQVPDLRPGALDGRVGDPQRPVVDRVARPAVVRVLDRGQVGHRPRRGPAAGARGELRERRLPPLSRPRRRVAATASLEAGCSAAYPP